VFVACFKDYPSSVGTEGDHNITSQTTSLGIHIRTRDLTIMK